MSALCGIIEKVLDDRIPGTVNKKYRYQTVYGYGFFGCPTPNCKHSWGSRLTWVTVDFLDARVMKRFGQKCRTCKSLAKPWWKDQEFEEMMQKAAKRYLRQITEKPPQEDGGLVSKPQPDIDLQEVMSKAPHETWLCEKCKFGQKPCWLKRKRERRKKKKKSQNAPPPNSTGGPC